MALPHYSKWLKINIFPHDKAAHNQAPAQARARPRSGHDKAGKFIHNDPPL
jgi:hypothetical protein